MKNKDSSKLNIKKLNIKKRLHISNILMIAVPVVMVGIFEGISELISLSVKEVIITQKIITWLIMMVVGVIAVFFTNRFLVRFVFQRINQSLDTFAEGVHNIRDGNLKYKIDYKDEDEFKPICEDFNEMAIRLKASVDETQKNEQSRKELIAGISHDLCSPLASIRMYAEGLRENIVTTEEARQDYLKTIIDKVDEITGKVNTLFLFSKMDIGDYPYYPEKIDIKKSITELAEAAKTDYSSKCLTVDIKDMPDGVYIYTDPLQLGSIFSNIIDNSQKYKTKETAAVSISCSTDGKTVKMVFEDDGPGVPEEDLTKLFDIFYRSDVARTNTQKGSGLGLAIVKKAVERTGGRIYAENAVRDGLRIVIEIPQFGSEDSQ